MIGALATPIVFWLLIGGGMGRSFRAPGAEASGYMEYFFPGTVLMILLFVGGVMNLAWIAGLTVLVMAEKWLAPGRAIARGAGVLLVVWGLATLWV